jgi:large subunit ribosomal protein L25
MASVALTSKLRTGTGKGVARKLRAAGNIPGVLYGPSIQPIHLELEHKAVQGLLQSKGINRIIELTVEGSDGGTHLCLIKEVVRDVYQTKVMHIDLRKVDMNEKIVVDVRVSLDGEQTLRAKGGIVEQMVRSVKVRTSPGNIPETISVDISGLRMGKTITVGELPLPEGAELQDNPDLPILNISAARGSAMTQG